MNASFTYRYYLVISEKRDDLWLSDDVFVGVFRKRGRGIKLKEKREILAVSIDLTKQITQPV